MSNVFSIVRELRSMGYEVKTTIVEKNGINKTGVQIMTGNNVGMIFYPNDYGLSESEIIKAIISHINNNNEYQDMLKGGILSNLSDVKDKLYLCIQPHVDNTNYITRPYLDIQQYVRFNMNDEMSTKVTQSLIDMWGINEDELFRIARENTKKSISIKPIGMALTDLGMGLEDLEVSNIIYPIVFTTNKYMYGASSMLITEELDRLASGINSDLYILPSSIHECLLIPEDIVEDVASLKQMVLEVNEQEVSKEEFLSNSVYKYMREPYKVYIAM